MTIPQTLPSTDELAAHAKDAVNKVGDHLTEQASLLRDTAADARYHAEDFIQANPWPAVLLATAIGFLFGLIVARR
jgi:ElaB/YqjD/DUF883 family membrane-anchored ribosome-binding protein